jgi:hypothetical protein
MRQMRSPAERMKAAMVAAVLPIALVLACKGEDTGPAGRAPGERAVTLEPVARLDDAGQPILAVPARLSVDPQGRFIIADRSDKDIKVYGPDGKRALTVGRPGRGPGEFLSLLTAQSYRDSILAWDVVPGRVSIFRADGRYARSFPLPRTAPQGFWVRAVDDSLLLIISPIPGGRSELLALVRPDGSVLSTFFDQEAHVGHDPAILQTVGLIADAAHGVVFAALSGGDSIWAFDYHGRQLGVGPADPAQPIIPTRVLIARNHGSARKADGTTVTHGNRSVTGIVALDSGSVALHVTRYDAKRGVDPLDGGTLIVATLDGAGGMRTIARSDVVAGLFGRDRGSAPLLLRYAGADQDSYEVVRARLATRSSPAARP